MRCYTSTQERRGFYAGEAKQRKQYVIDFAPALYPYLYSVWGTESFAVCDQLTVAPPKSPSSTDIVLLKGDTSASKEYH
jgi:hypothetical protein